MNRAKRLALLLVAVFIGVCASSIAFAAGVTLPFSGSDGNTINACYSSGGALKVLTPSEPSCPKGYTAISWNATGPQGPQGPQGPAGTIDSLRTFNAFASEDLGVYDSGTARATCPDGSIVTGGGAVVGDADLDYQYKDGNDWIVRASAGIFGGFVQSYAVCLTTN